MKFLKVIALSSLLALGMACTKKAEEAGAPTDPAAQAGANVALNITIEPANAGTVNPPAGQFPKDAPVTLEAVANPGFAFDHWEGDVSGAEKMTQVIMNADKNVKAVFKQGDAAAAPAAAPADAAAPAATPEKK